MLNQRNSVHKLPADLSGSFAGTNATKMRQAVPVLQKTEPKISSSVTTSLVIQRVLWGKVKDCVEMSENYVVADPHDRNEVETRMVVDILLSLKIPTNKIYAVIDQAKLDWETVSPLTREYIINYLKGKDFPIQPDVIPQAPITDRFAEMAKSKEGYYYWEQPSDSNFQTWLANDDPALESNARLNCWEAILVTAVQAGVMEKSSLKGLDGDAIQKLIRGGAATLDTTIKKNSISKGDVIVIDSAGDESWHVVMAVEVNPDNFKEIKVMSHYRNGDNVKSSVFAKTTLGEIFATAKNIGLEKIIYKALE